MASWHKPARLAVAVFGLAMAGIVYWQLGERQAVEARPPVERTDDKAVFEAKGCNWARTLPSSITQIVDIECELVQGFEDGSTRIFGLKRIVVRRGDKEFIATGSEAYVGPNSKVIEITGEVKLRASDGFEMQTDRASFSEDEGIAQAPGAVTFARGRMSGSGTGISWDQNGEVLLIGEAAHIVLKDDGGNTTTELTASSATLDRQNDLLLLNDGAHVLKGQQVIDARDAVAQLTPDESAITFVTLNGDARVTGAGSSIDSMSARDIDLDYTADGQTLEGVVMRGGSAIAMTGQNGNAGRQILSESLDIGLAPDGSLLRVAGRDKAQIDLPAAGNAPKRSIQSASLDAKGQPGKGLTDAMFIGEVTFVEEPAKGAGRRTARSERLEVTLVNDAVATATFTGRASFEEQGLVAGAPKIDYRPEKGVLQLTGTDRTVAPCVANDRFTVDAQTIDVTLQGQDFTAKGNVKTTLRAEGRGGTTCGGRAVSGAAPKAGTAGTKLPGLLDQKGVASVTAQTVQYQGAAGRVVYTGSPATRATLVQGTTSVRANTISIDQSSGDLTATGGAITAITLDKQDAQGEAQEIRYVDAKRTITLFVPAPPRDAPPRPPGAAVPVARLYGPQGDMRAGRIDVHLAKEDSAVERIEAAREVSIQLKTRSVSAAERLTYLAADEKYEMFGNALRPLIWLERDGKDCRENTGTALAFGKDGSSAILDGQQRRFQTAPKPCPPALR